MADMPEASECPVVSVVVPVRNGMPWVEHQLRALATQEPRSTGKSWWPTTALTMGPVPV